MENSGEALTSGDEGDQYLTEIEGALTAVADIWLGATSDGVGCGVRAEICGGGKGLLAQDRCLLQIFGQIPCRFGIFWSG